MRFPSFITFRVLEVISFIHSTIYLTLLICAFALNNTQPATLIFGWAHGCIWIVMSLTCIWAARSRVIPFWLAVTVCVFGAIGPFFGTAGFIIEDRRRRRAALDLRNPASMPLKFEVESAAKESADSYGR